MFAKLGLIDYLVSNKKNREVLDILTKEAKEMNASLWLALGLFLWAGPALLIAVRAKGPEVARWPWRIFYAFLYWPVGMVLCWVLVDLPGD